MHEDFHAALLNFVLQKINVSHRFRAKNGLVVTSLKIVVLELINSEGFIIVMRDNF
jgi:hypothetical protein